MPRKSTTERNTCWNSFHLRSLQASSLWILSELDMVSRYTEDTRRSSRNAEDTNFIHGLMQPFEMGTLRCFLPSTHIVMQTQISFLTLNHSLPVSDRFSYREVGGAMEQLSAIISCADHRITQDLPLHG